MTAKRAQTTVARVGDRTYTVPARIPETVIAATAIDAGSEPETLGRFQVSASVDVVDGEPRFRTLSFQFFEPLTAQEVQRLRWGVLAEAVIEANVESDDGRAKRNERVAVRGRRTRDRTAERQRTYRRSAPSRRSRTANDEAKLLEVLALRREAEDKGVPYAAYVACRLGYSTAYVRRMAKQARDRGLEAPGRGPVSGS